jgi:hypothetical protein
MANINQNFSIVVGDDMDVDYDIGPDTTGLDLNAAQQLTWKAYTQTLGVPDKTTVLISKDQNNGIIIIDPSALTFTVHFDPIDSVGQNGNLYYEIKIVDLNGRVSTPTIGLMTVIDPSVTPNVAAFKTMFPELASVDDTLVQIAIDQASQFVDDTWGKSEADATMYLAAHFMALAQATASSGGRLVTSETIGRISVSYASVSAASKTSGVDPLASTGYGLIFSNMLARQGFGIAIV